MDLLIFTFLFFIEVLFLLLSYLTEGENYFFSIVSSTMFIILGLLLLTEDLTVTYSGPYGFVAANTSSMIGIVTSTVSYNNIYIKGLGTIFMVAAIYMALVPFIEKNIKDPETKDSVVIE